MPRDNKRGSKLNNLGDIIVATPSPTPKSNSKSSKSRRKKQKQKQQASLSRLSFSPDHIVLVPREVSNTNIGLRGVQSHPTPTPRPLNRMASAPERSQLKIPQLKNRDPHKVTLWLHEWKAYTRAFKRAGQQGLPNIFLAIDPLVQDELEQMGLDLDEASNEQIVNRISKY